MLSLMRAACCIECVTMTTVYSFFRSPDQVFDLPRRDGVERRGRLVHQNHFGVDGQAARDAESLLLAARERERRTVEPIFDLVPKRGAAQTALADFHQHARAGARREFAARRRRCRRSFWETGWDAERPCRCGGGSSPDRRPVRRCPGRRAARALRRARPASDRACG